MEIVDKALIKAIRLVAYVCKMSHIKQETDMGGKRIQMTLTPFRSAGSHVEW